jgi:phosphoserine phosphatase RsbU/P
MLFINSMYFISSAPRVCADSRFHKPVGAPKPFSTYEKEFFSLPPGVDFSHTGTTKGQRFDMTSNAVIPESYNDLAAACATQQQFLQHASSAVKGVRYDGRCRQLGEVGGDCYDCIPLPDGRLAFAIADASGKGLAAALSILGLQSSLRTAVRFAEGDPETVVAAVNHQVHASSAAERYATLFYGLFDETTGKLCYVNAGHNPPIVIHRDGSSEELGACGLPVGMFPGADYREAEVQLRAGDRIVAYTDGVTEAANGQGEEFGVEGLRQVAISCAGRAPEAIVRAIFDSVDRFADGRQNDDATVLVLQIL